MRFVIIQDDEELRERLIFWLESHYNVAAEGFPSVDEGLSTIHEQGVSPDLVIFDFQKSVVKEFRRFRKMVGPKLPCVVCLPGIGGVPDQLEQTVTTALIDRNQIVDGISQTLTRFSKNQIFKEALQSHEDRLDLEDGFDGEFCKIKTRLLLSVCPLKCDVYIRLSALKYVRLFKRGDGFERGDFDKYTGKKGVQYLYLKRSEIDEFIEKFTIEIERMLHRTKLTVEDSATSCVDVHDTAQELIRTIGLTVPVQNLITTQVKVTTQAMGKNPKLAHMLAYLDNIKGEYISKHSTLCAYLACAIASQMDWGSEATYQKLNMAAFLHDITLQNNAVARCQTMDDFYKGQFGSVEYEKFKNHSLHAAQLATTFREIPPNVDTIIQQHHERPDGKGFPRGAASAALIPLTTVFVVAHELALFHLRTEKQKVTIQDFLREVKHLSESNRFRKVVEAVLKAFENPI